MKRIFLLTLAAMVMVAGCKGKEEEKQAESLWLAGFSQCTFEDPWRINMNNEMKAAVARHPEIKLVISDGQNNNAKQIADVENFIVRGIDLLIISPREAAPLTPVVEKAYDRGIPVIVLDRAIRSDKYTCFIGASNMEIGRGSMR
jgi:ribose transport system substrate-binding protein